MPTAPCTRRGVCDSNWLLSVDGPLPPPQLSPRGGSFPTPFQRRACRRAAAVAALNSGLLRLGAKMQVRLVEPKQSLGIAALVRARIDAPLLQAVVDPWMPSCRTLDQCTARPARATLPVCVARQARCSPNQAALRFATSHAPPAPAPDLAAPLRLSLGDLGRGAPPNFFSLFLLPRSSSSSSRPCQIALEPVRSLCLSPRELGKFETGAAHGCPLRGSAPISSVRQGGASKFSVPTRPKFFLSPLLCSRLKRSPSAAQAQLKPSFSPLGLAAFATLACCSSAGIRSLGPIPSVRREPCHQRAATLSASPSRVGPPSLSSRVEACFECAPLPFPLQRAPAAARLPPETLRGQALLLRLAAALLFALPDQAWLLTHPLAQDAHDAHNAHGSPLDLRTWADTSFPQPPPPPPTAELQYIPSTLNPSARQSPPLPLPQTITPSSLNLGALLIFVEAPSPSGPASLAIPTSPTFSRLVPPARLAISPFAPIEPRLFHSAAATSFRTS
ncbi:hypothetical protein PANT_11c00073 [Moesziomyces antarcticus T-34]|uniref:Uncharacterized protein n=1 Tax=Pseudozyma antarctica (strain T-34) TaxID=1151754 RepID=M9M2N1_PSEA3|nr:hypothetical protein PANT_11c00073 [Moesziomyces antarcticus T-34]